MRPGIQRQTGISTIATIGAFVGIGVVFLIVFFIGMSGGSKNDTTNNKQTTTNQSTGTDTATASGPPFIRIPENSKIYNNAIYKFSFAYPDSFGELLAKSDTVTDGSLKVLGHDESATATKLPIGTTNAVLSGTLGVLVYAKDNFSVTVNNGVTVAPTQTGNDVTWKIISRGTSTQDIALGQPVTIKTVKSQTGVTVFDFTSRPNAAIVQARWVFVSGDTYAMITLPLLNKPEQAAISDADMAAYNVVGKNIAKTVRAAAQNTTKTNPTTGTSTDSSASSSNSTSTKSATSLSNLAGTSN
jgi:hypothetical protein